MNPASAYSVRMSPFQIRKYHRTTLEPQKHGEPAHQQRGAALAVGEPVELNGKACAEQQREQRKCLELDGLGQDRFDGAIDR